MDYRHQEDTQLDVSGAGLNEKEYTLQQSPRPSLFVKLDNLPGHRGATFCLIERWLPA